MTTESAQPVRDADDGALVRRLWTIEELRQLKARYFRLMDTKQWDDWGLVFTTAAVMDVPEADMIVTGRDEIVAAVSAALENARTVHHGHMPEIEVTGNDTARGTWAMFDYVEWPQPDGSRVAMHGYGHYLEEYVVEDGRWRIARIRLERLRVDALQP